MNIFVISQVKITPFSCIPRDAFADWRNLIKGLKVFQLLGLTITNVVHLINIFIFPYTVQRPILFCYSWSWTKKRCCRSCGFSYCNVSWKQPRNEMNVIINCQSSGRIQSCLLQKSGHFCIAGDWECIRSLNANSLMLYCLIYIGLYCTIEPL